MNAPAPPTLRVLCAGAVYTLTRDRAQATIGRSQDADVPVADPRASRADVRLELDGGYGVRSTPEAATGYSSAGSVAPPSTSTTA